MPISISSIVSRKYLRSTAGGVVSDNHSLNDLAEWHTKYSWPTGPSGKNSPVNFGKKNVEMSKFGADNNWNVSTCLHYVQMYPESQYKNSAHPYNTSAYGDGQIKIRARGFRPDSGGYTDITLTGVHDTYDETKTGIGVTAATAAHFKSLGGTDSGSVGRHYDAKITYYNEQGTAKVTTWNRLQMGHAGGSSSTYGGNVATDYFESYPESISGFKTGHCLAFINGGQCSSFRWSDSTTPKAATWSSWMICHGEQMLIGTTGQGGPDGYQDGGDNRHGSTA